MKKKILMIFAVLLMFAGHASAGTWTTLDYPGAWDTEIYGIKGSYLVGSADGHGIVYNTSTPSWTTLNKSGASSTEIHDTDGSNFVGSYRDGSTSHCFLYDGTNWTTLDKEGANFTEVYGVSGTDIVGFYGDTSGGVHGFLYNGGNYTTFDIAGATGTWITGIEGSNIFGSYSDASGWHNFLHNLGSGVTNIFDAPPMVRGISGDYMVGNVHSAFMTTHAFFYDGIAWLNINAPGSYETTVSGIEGNKVVGYYTDHSSGKTHGFVYEIPEPATLALLGLGLSFFRTLSAWRQKI